MTTIYTININNGKNEVVNAFMKMMVPHVVANEVIKSEFGPQVTELQTQAERFATALENHRFSLLTEKVTQADTRRDKKWTAAKAVLVAEMESSDPAHRAAAETINKLYDSFGKIRGMGLAEQSGAMSSLCNDLLKNHEAELTLTGLLPLIQNLQTANNEFIAAYEERTESRSELVLGETREAKKALITAYRTLIFLINAHILQKGSDGLDDFIAYANELIRQYRQMIGQKPAPGQDESLDEGLEDEELDGDVDDGDNSGTNPPTNSPTTPPATDPTTPPTTDPTTPPTTDPTTPPTTDPTNPDDETNDELTAATGITVKWTYNRAAVPEGSLLAKEMIVAPGSTIPASEWPEAHPGFHWNSTPEQMNDSVPYKRPGEWYYVREQPDE